MNKIIILFFILTPLFSIAQEEKSTVKEEIYQESIPEFPGGMKNFYSYVYKSLKYPKDARKRKIEGKVFIQFEIDTTGFIISDKLVVTRGLSESLDKEALRLFRESPKWKPGYQNEKPVKVTMTLPITFKLM